MEYNNITMTTMKISKKEIENIKAHKLLKKNIPIYSFVFIFHYTLIECVKKGKKKKKKKAKTKK